MRVAKGDISLWRLHYERLSKGLVRLGIHLPISRLMTHMSASMAAIGDYEGVLKLSVTRGDGARGYGLTGEEKPRLITQFSPLVTDFYTTNHPLEQAGVDVHICQTRLPVGACLAGLKSLNQLPYVLASQERQGTPWHEGIMFNHDGRLIEATARNLFLVKGHTLYTPSLVDSGVNGVMRRLIIDILAPATNIAVHEIPLTEKNLFLADEVFLSNSISHIWPIRHCEGHSWSVGAVTQSLQVQARQFIRDDKTYCLSSFTINT